MTGYTRQSAAQIVPGEDIEAGPLAAEFNALHGAFNGATGHSHDGSTGNGPRINLATSVQGYLQPLNGGVGGRHNTAAGSAPDVSNDASQGYVPGSIWIVPSTQSQYTCISNATNAAIWALNEKASGSFLQVGQNLSDVLDKSIARTNLQLVPGTHVQAYSAGLKQIADVAQADRVPYSTAAGTYGYATITAFGRSLIDDENATAARTTIGLGNVDNTSDADKPVSTATLAALNGKLDKAGGTVTGPLNLQSVLRLEPITLAANNGAADFSLRSIFNMSMSAAMTMAVANLADGQSGQVFLTYTAGSLSFSGVDRWAVSDAETATTFTTTAVGVAGLVANATYEFIFTRSGGITQGRVGRHT